MIGYRAKAAELISPLIPELSKDDLFSRLELPQKDNLGDIAFPCFLLAKARKQSPAQIATSLAAALVPTHDFNRVEAVGPYLNFYLSESAASAFVQRALQENATFGSLPENYKPQSQKILLEYSSPNVAKEFHIGHFRNTILGQSLANLLRNSGHEVIALNHLGDWGSQFGKVVYAFQHWGNEEDLKTNPIDYLTKLYVRFHEHAETDPELDKEAQKIFRRIEEKDPELTQIWQRFVSISIEALKKMYARLGAHFDHFIGESFYFDKIEQLIALLKSKNLLEEDDGAQIVRLEEEDLPPCLILTGQGTSLYATRDLAAAIYRHEHFHFDECLYVVGSEQTLHFRQFFAVLRKMGYPWAKSLEHISYGMYRFKDASFSTRKGRVILARDVIEQTKQKVLDVINEKNPNLSQKEKTAEIVALGALYFNDLSTDRNKDVEFSWDKILDFEGDTGPYVQYTHARACSILRKGNYSETNAKQEVSEAQRKEIVALAAQPAAAALMKTLGSLITTAQSAANQRRPSVVANYCLYLAKKFNTFYREIKVIDDNDSTEARQAKLQLVDATRITLKNALGLLCIQAPTEM